jgi:hypothetical protein
LIKSAVHAYAVPPLTILIDSSRICLISILEISSAQDLVFDMLEEFAKAFSAQNFQPFNFEGELVGLGRRLSQQKHNRLGSIMSVPASQSQLAETLIGAEELECLLDFADWLFQQVAGIWNSSPENKRRIQSALFPDGLSVTREGFGTTPLPIFFRTFQEAALEKEGLASPGGFEPPLPP